MKKIIQNKVYDTTTAKEIGTYKADYPVNAFAFYTETLYKKRTGEYFIHGKGGGLSKYAGTYNDMRGPGEKIMPLTFDEARKWAEEKLKVVECEKEFGSSDEDGMTNIHLQIPTVLADKVEKEKSETGKPIRMIITEALESRYTQL
ncbi:MAG: hypothetical protein Q4B80_01700 [Aerococcaceae bacterium]|nr:hypothetical protein [Aerococcaceae bacterium]